MRKLMWFTLGFGGACAWGAYITQSCSWPIFAVSVILSVFLACLDRRGAWLKAGAAVFAGLAAGTAAFWVLCNVHLGPAQVLDGQTVQISVRADDYCVETEYGFSVDGTVDTGERSYRVLAYLDRSDAASAVAPGDKITGEFLLRSTFSDDQKATGYHRSEGIFLIAYQRGDITVVTGESRQLRDAPARMRYKIKRCLDQLFSSETAGVTKALLLGDTSDLSYKTDTAFKLSGIRHIVAVSGLHISILFSAAYLLCGKRRGLTALIGIPALLIFSAVAGFTPSVTRACIMQLLVIVAMLCDREYDPPTALAFSVLVMLIINPLSITSVSFQLSVGCMSGVFLFSDRLRCWLLSEKCLGHVKGNGLAARAKRWFAGGVSVTLSATLMTAPLCAWYFGTVSLVSMVTNLLTLWAVSASFYGLMFVCVMSLVCLPVARGAAWLVSWLVRFVLFVAEVLGKLPFAAVYTKSIYIVMWLIFCYILLTAFLLMKKKRPEVFAGCIVLGLTVALLISWVMPMKDECRMTVLDVGQGQCILLQSDGKTYMVDCGGKGPERTADEAAQTLLSQGVTRLDGLILTHFDGDHSEGAVNFLQRMETDVVIVPVSGNAETADEILGAAGGRVVAVSDIVELSFGDTTLRIIPSLRVDSDNESGLSVLFQTENCAILITGDQDEFGERILMKKTCLPDLDVLVAGHHGAKDSACAELLAATRPETAVISVGADNPYGHPSEETLRRLEEYGCGIYRTDLHGTIVYRR